MSDAVEPAVWAVDVELEPISGHGVTTGYTQEAFEALRNRIKAVMPHVNHSWSGTPDELQRLSWQVQAPTVESAAKKASAEAVMVVNAAGLTPHRVIAVTVKTPSRGLSMRETNEMKRLSDLVRWCFAASMQLDRVEAESAAGMGDPRTAQGGRSHAARATDLHFLFIALRHVGVAWRRAPAGLRAKFPPNPIITIAAEELRHIAEHWDSHELVLPISNPTQAVARLLTVFPNAVPGTLRWNPQEGITVAGVVNLREVRSELDALNQYASARLTKLRDAALGREMGTFLPR